MTNLTTLKNAIRKIIAVTIPILIAQLSTMGVNFINTSMAGHSGANDLAGVSVASGIFYPFEAAVIGLLMAATPIMAQLLGRRERSSIPSVVRTGFYIALVLDILLALGCWLFVDGTLAKMSLTPEVARVAKYYIWAMLGAVFFISLIIPLRSLTDTVAGPAVSMKLFMLALPLSAGLNWLFIFGNAGFPRLGGIGAGVSALVTYAVIFVLFLLLVVKEPTLMGRAIFSTARVRAADVKDYLNVGIPSGLSVFMEMGLFGAIIFFMARFGTDTLAAYQIADNFANMAYMIPISFSMALTILVARAVGEGNRSEADRYAKAGLLLSVGFSAVEVGLTISLRTHIGMLYTNETAVIHIASQFLIFASAFQFFDSVSAPIQGILRGYKDTKVPFILLVTAYWLICMPASLLLDNHSHLGAFSYWIGLDLGFFCATLLMALRLWFIRRGLTPGEVLTAADRLDEILTLRAAAAEALLREKIAVLLYAKSIEKKDVYIPTKTVLEILGNKLTDIHRQVVGHATSAYVP